MKNKHSVLFVDDDPEYRKAIGRLFERSGYDIAVAADGIEALNALSGAAFDVVISGLRMPNLDGIGLMEEIRRKKLELPVVFVTAHGDVESYMDVMNMGAFEYLNKPVSGQTILNVAEAAIAHYGASSGALRP